jgi:hypothetical protein
VSVPLIEPIEGDSNFRWITFLWHGDARTHEVSVGSGDIPTPDPSKWTFKRIGNSNLWFKTDRDSVEQAPPYCKDPARLPDPSTLRRWVQRRVFSLWCWIKAAAAGKYFFAPPTILPGI